MDRKQSFIRDHMTINRKSAALKAVIRCLCYLRAQRWQIPHKVRRTMITKWLLLQIILVIVLCIIPLRGFSNLRGYRLTFIPLLTDLFLDLFSNLYLERGSSICPMRFVIPSTSCCSVTVSYISRLPPICRRTRMAKQ
jgi:predicted histidine transporter YuiF (NhaC family)